MGKLRANVSDLTTAFFAIAKADYIADRTTMPSEQKSRPISQS